MGNFHLHFMKMKYQMIDSSKEIEIISQLYIF